jgi:hypothetical protein
MIARRVQPSLGARRSGAELNVLEDGGVRQCEPPPLRPLT